MKKLVLPIKDRGILKKFKKGDFIYLSGSLYTARDKAHKRLIEEIKMRKSLPLDLKNQFLYYTGPTPSPPGKIAGAIGPTTSARMDKYTSKLLSLGIAGTIGKGRRDKQVVEAVRKYKGIYLVTIGGLGAYLSKKIKKLEIAAYKSLGAEAIYKLEIEDFPVLVAIDSRGKTIY